MSKEDHEMKAVAFLIPENAEVQRCVENNMQAAFPAFPTNLDPLSFSLP